MKKNITLLILGILTMSMLSGCAKTTDTTQTDTQVAKVEQPATAIKADEKKDETKPEVKETIKEEVKPDVPKETDVTVATKPAQTPAVTQTKTSSNVSTTKQTTSTPVSTPTPTPKPAPAPTPVVNKPSGLASINNEWRVWYRRLYATRYTGDKLAEFDALTINLANGSISKAQAETKLKDLGVWTESKTNLECQIFRVYITVYTRASNDVQTIVGDLNNKGLLTGGTFCNSYIYYDSSIKKNRVIIMALDMPSTF